MKLKLFTQNGQEKGTVTVSDELFGGAVNEALLHSVATAYLANKRQGTAKTKGRSEVSGGGRKPWKQKGTGRARAGSNTSPVWVRGGKAFGPVVRDYWVNIPRKMRKLALRQALASRAQTDRVVVIESISCTAPKTRTIADMLKSLPLGESRKLLITDGSKNLYLSGRNIPNLKVSPVSGLNALDVLRSEHVIIGAKELVPKLEEVVTQ